MQTRRHTSLLPLVIAVLVGTATPAAAATARDLNNCQKQLTRQLRSLAKFTATRVHNCTERVVRCKLTDEIDNVDATACIASAAGRCSAGPAAISTQVGKRRGNIIAKCGLLPLADVTQFVAGLGFFDVAAQCASLAPPLTPITVNNVDDLVDCLLTTTQCSAQRQVFRRDPRAQDSLTAAGVAASFPCVAP